MAFHLQQQIANLDLNNVDVQNGMRKVRPAVPPKPKKQPMVPKSYSLKTPCEPSYSTLLQSSPAPQVPSNSETKNALYSNVTLAENSAPMYSNLQTLENPTKGQALYGNICTHGSNHIDNTYSNVGVFPGNSTGVDELPPPPPEPSDYNQCAAPNFPPPPDDLPPPPSPVSSSYSELRQATYHPHYQPDYGSYGPSSQSSTYESIYEPINPRPPSQMSSRSNYSLYAPYVSGSQSKESSTATPTPPVGKEAEVDALTDLLVQSMDGSSDSDIYGICTSCGERVVGEGSGCTAMDQVYHISCFTCQHCAIQLQGKPFYALDGKPYCEEDYLNTLEKCSVCMKPILDRILRATGKPYHPQCFTCIVCGKSLDGIPFTVDATNQIHCIEDFHKKFAPRCCVCKLPIMPEPGQEETVRVVALDRSFHISCYKCEDCGLVLSSEAEGRGCYPLDDHVLCKSCNAKRVQALTSHMTTEL
ncbi:lipoma-preferred partner homolog [Bacillus rossius redtenbacheri]|uniref:lipoma-preferred partner homolog n=1 Tax=Bacillus rossius redtenbacheri TaxID=93214 RepID=UPI002FDDB091